VIDFFGGSRDIKEKVIRVLHNLAFVEDPTRIMRALRFSSRFGFAIGKHTLSLMKGAIKLKVFDKVEGKRLLNELIHTLNEKNPVPGLTLMGNLGILQALHPALSMPPRKADLVEAVSGVLSWWKYLFVKGEKLDGWVVYLLALTETLSDEDFVAVMHRFSLPPSQVVSLVKERLEMRHALAVYAKGRVARPSEHVAVLRRFSNEALLFMMAKTSREETRKAISEYITILRNVKPLVTGRDLIAMGYEPGPIFTRILHELRNARLDGKVGTEEEEIALVRRLFPRTAGEPVSLIR
jgi:tRNA nucleotidyltransferase (CCA-adding enzyme)